MLAFGRKVRPDRIEQLGTSAIDRAFSDAQPVY